LLLHSHILPAFYAFGWELRFSFAFWTWIGGCLINVKKPGWVKLCLKACSSNGLTQGHFREQQYVSQHTFVEFPEGMHMDTWMQGGERYWRSIEIFLEKNAAGAKCILHNKLDSAKVVAS
jgi:hypothetical protein